MTRAGDEDWSRRGIGSGPVHRQFMNCLGEAIGIALEGQRHLPAAAATDEASSEPKRESCSSARAVLKRCTDLDPPARHHHPEVDSKKPSFRHGDGRTHQPPSCTTLDPRARSGHRDDLQRP